MILVQKLCWNTWDKYFQPFSASNSFWKYKLTTFLKNTLETKFSKNKTSVMLDKHLRLQAENVSGTIQSLVMVLAEILLSLETQT